MTIAVDLGRKATKQTKTMYKLSKPLFCGAQSYLRICTGSVRVSVAEGSDVLLISPSVYRQLSFSAFDKTFCNRPIKEGVNPRVTKVPAFFTCTVAYM